MKRMLEELLRASPVGQVLLTTDYQFGPGDARRRGPLSFAEFAELYNAGQVRMDTAYLITAT